MEQSMARAYAVSLYPAEFMDNRDSEAENKGYLIKWDYDKNKVYLVSPWGEAGGFDLRAFLISTDDIHTFFSKNF